MDGMDGMDGMGDDSDFDSDSDFEEEEEEDVIRRWFSRVGIIWGVEKVRGWGFWRAAFEMLKRARVRLSRMRSWRRFTAEVQRVSEGKRLGSWKPEIGGGVRGLEDEEDEEEEDEEEDSRS